MKLIAIAAAVLAPACTIFDFESRPAEHDAGVADASNADLYKLTFDHSVAAEASIHGVDSDGQGNLWIVYTTEGDYATSTAPVVSLVHWDPQSGERLATFTYADIFSPVSGIALVGDELWMTYEQDYQDAVTRVIDPSDGSIVRTIGTTGIELAAMSSDRVLVSPQQDALLVLDASTGGEVQSIATSFSLGTQQGVAWRPGEIWAGGWLSPMEIYDETGSILGTIALPALISESADPVHHLAFDDNKLLVGADGQLTWYAIAK